VKEITTIGLDLAKQVFQVHGADARGHAVLRRKLRRSQVLPYFAQLPPCVVGMEACAGAHYWARQIERLGHAARLIPPQYVKPYVKTHKTDMADAEAICEAVQRPGMRFVPIKNAEQQAILAVHRARESLVRARTATANHIRGLLSEYGIVLPQGMRYLAKVREAMINHELPGVFCELIDLQLEHLREIDGRIDLLEKQLALWYRGNEACQRLRTIPGVGLLTATAIVASVGSARHFSSGRHLASWVGLVPRQHSTGGKARLMGMSKRGDGYLRRLLIHGARAVLRHAQKQPEAERLWHVRLMLRRHKNVAAVALANKNARTIWALLTSDAVFDPLRRVLRPAPAV